MTYRAVPAPQAIHQCTILTSLTPSLEGFRVEAQLVSLSTPGDLLERCRGVRQVFGKEFS